MSFSRCWLRISAASCTLVPMDNPGSAVLAGIGRVFYCCYWAPLSSLRAMGLPLLNYGFPVAYRARLASSPAHTLPPLRPLTTMPTLGRHDDPEEKRQDAIRAEINAGHRFESFAAETSENF
ncbi:hypothetical protein B0H16DRAFT_1734536 [Mycena metata]|uniref:Uncharacterized protein n=1 Tax=Mycena metata TaxID=1033252 RepID=A0AAD7HWL0_9AGAR|nr:hypothetical protein B0H16DRAFT_1734536 [Mycena metata]